MGRILCVCEHHRLAYFMNMPVGYPISFSDPPYSRGHYHGVREIKEPGLLRGCVYICTNLLSIEHIG